MNRFVDVGRVMDAVRRNLPGTVEGEKRLETYIKRQPKAPRLISRRGAADMLGIHSPHIARLQEQGRMPDPIEVDEGAPVWLTADIEELAAEMKKEREARERKARAAKQKREERAARKRAGTEAKAERAAA